MKLELPTRLAGCEIRLSAPGAEEYVAGPVAKDGTVEILGPDKREIPAKFYHLSYRPKGELAWSSDPKTVACHLGEGSAPQVGDVVHPPKGHHKPMRTREEAEKALAAWRKSLT